MGKRTSDLPKSEIEAAFKLIGRNKAPGTDGIPIELFQALDDDAVEALTRVHQCIWTTWQWPTDWKCSVYILIPKKADNKTCENYQTIAL